MVEEARVSFDNLLPGEIDKDGIPRINLDKLERIFRFVGQGNKLVPAVVRVINPYEQVAQLDGRHTLVYEYLKANGQGDVLVLKANSPDDRITTAQFPWADQGIGITRQHFISWRWEKSKETAESSGFRNFHEYMAALRIKHPHLTTLEEARRYSA